MQITIFRIIHISLTIQPPCNTLYFVYIIISYGSMNYKIPFRPRYINNVSTNIECIFTQIFIIFLSFYKTIKLSHNLSYHHSIHSTNLQPDQLHASYTFNRHHLSLNKSIKQQFNGNRPSE